MTTIAPADVQPAVGETYGPNEHVASKDLIRAYVNSMGDEGFARHAAAMQLAIGKTIAPPTLFDRDLGTRLFASKHDSLYALHAKQAFEFCRPLEEGLTYTISGKLVNTYVKNDIGYITIESICVAPDGEVSMISTYTRAFSFPGNHYKHKSGERVRPTVNSFLEQNGAKADANFPAVGSVLEGVSRELSQALMNLYSGPVSGIHTDSWFARRRGHPDTIVQGLQSTALECELYREVFGAAWYTSGKIAVKYINNIDVSSRLTPIAVVVSNEGGVLEMQSAVHTQKLELIAVGSVSVKL